MHILRESVSYTVYTVTNLQFCGGSHRFRHILQWIIWCSFVPWKNVFLLYFINKWFFIWGFKHFSSYLLIHWIDYSKVCLFIFSSWLSSPSNAFAAFLSLWLVASVGAAFGYGRIISEENVVVRITLGTSHDKFDDINTFVQDYYGMGDLPQHV